MPLFPAAGATLTDPDEDGWLTNRSAPTVSADTAAAVTAAKDAKWEKAARKRELAVTEQHTDTSHRKPSRHHHHHHHHHHHGVEKRRRRHRSPISSSPPPPPHVLPHSTRMVSRSKQHDSTDAPQFAKLRQPSTARASVTTARLFKDTTRDGDGDVGWFTDVEPDRKNLEYSTLYVGDVVKYRRGTNWCLTRKGATPVAYSDGRDRRLPRGADLATQHKASRYFSNASAKAYLDSLIPLKRVVPQKPVPKKKRWDSLTLAEPATRSFISVITVDDAEEEDEAETRDAWVLRRTAEFNRQIADTPDNVDLWLGFVDFQDEAVPSDNETRRRDTIVLDKQLAIFERGLKQNARSDVMTAEYLELCRRKMDLAEVEARWKKTVFTHASSVRLWRDCLGFFTSELSQFSVVKAQAQYSKALEVWSSFVSGSFSSHKVDMAKAEATLVDIATESIYFTRQCGFGERALAAFQAVIEMTCFGPAELRVSGHHSKLMAIFELFWESGCARFGDSDAGGFQAWYETRKMGGETPVAAGRPNVAAEPAEDLGVLAPWQRWIQLETWREQAHWRPWVPNEAAGETDDDCDDPDRMVVLDDVVGHAMILRGATLQHELMARFFDFCGAPMRRRHSSGHQYVHDRFRMLEEVGDLFAPLAHEIEAHKARYVASDIVTDFEGPVVFGHTSNPDYPFGVNAGQDSRLWGFGRLAPLSLDSTTTERGWIRPPPILDLSRRKFIEDAFEQSIRHSPDSTYLKLSLIDFVADGGGLKAAKKCCKALLKVDRNNLHLLGRYAALEFAAGKVDDAWLVYETALAMGQQGDSHTRTFSIARPPFVWLCRGFAELLVESGRLDRAAVVLAACAGEPWASVSTITGPLPPTVVAKIRSALERAIAPWTGAAPAMPLGSAGCDLVACRALFEYCTVGLGASVAIYERVESSVVDHERHPTTSDADRMEYERLREGAALLIHWHGTQRRKVSPGVLRGVLERGLDLYPANTTLLTLYVANEARSRVAGRIRARFTLWTKERRCPVVVFLFAIYAELSQAHGASVHRTRTLFSAATRDVAARRCPLLWRMHIEFERAQPSPTALEFAQTAFYRAIQNCPGTKSLYLDGPARVPSLFQEALDVLQEKELHLRTPLEEVGILEQAEAIDAAAAATAAEQWAYADLEQDREADEVEAVLAEEARRQTRETHAYLASVGGTVPVPP